MKSLLIAGLSICLFFTACKKTVDPPDPAAAETRLNVAYGTDPAQVMDVYLPAGHSTSTTKVMIMIHGGGWTSGDKNDFNAYIDTLKRRLPGYAIFNINYRLETIAANRFPTQENDVKSAVAYIYGHAADFGVSTKFVLLGASAGGHLALLQAYKYYSLQPISAVVDFFGPTDLTDMYNNPASIFVQPAALAEIVGGTPTTLPAMYQQSSPLFVVTTSAAPTIILQGGVDPLVAPSQSLSLSNKLQTLGITHQYVYYPTESHGWTGANLTDSFDKITAFLNANVH